MKRKRREWTSEEIEKAINMYDKNYTFSDISRELNRGRGSIKTKLNSMGMESTKHIDKDYVYEVNDVVNETLLILEKLRIQRKSKNQTRTEKGYMVKSLVYDDAEPYKIQESVLKKGIGCAYLNGHRVCPSNSLWSIEKVRKNIINIEEAKTLKTQSNKKLK